MEGYKAVVLVAIIMLSSGGRRAVVAEDSKCECGVFKFPTAQTTKEFPLIARAPQFNFECNADGKESCSNMCKALSTASKQQGPTQICEIVKDTDTAFVPVIYYRACDDDVWTFTGLKSTLNICCKAGAAIPCA